MARGRHQFDRVVDNVSHNVDILLLPDAVDAVDGLGFCHGVPMGLDNVHRVCTDKIDPIRRSA